MQAISKGSTRLLSAVRNSTSRTDYRNISRCLYTRTERRTFRNQDRPCLHLAPGNDTSRLTYSVINTLLQRQLCTNPPDKKGSPRNVHHNELHSSQASESDSSLESAPDFEEVESKQEGLLDEEIEDFYREEEVEEEEESEWVSPVSLARGKTGVFDIEDLVTVLRAENAKEICVIEIPPEVKLTSYMVIASAISIRHLRAIISSVNYIYKQKKHKTDPFLLISGASDPSSEWLAVDLGNAFLHVMMPETRQRYDIEGLWMLGDDPQADSDQEGGGAGDFEWVKELRLERESNRSTQQAESGNSNQKTAKTPTKEEEHDWIN